MFFEQKTIEDIINLRFNPGEGIAQYCMCERWVSILVCRPRGIAETEHLQDHKHATEATRGTHMLKEASNLTTAKPCLLASTFHDVQRNVRIFLHICARALWQKMQVLFNTNGREKIFNYSSTQTIQDAFNINVCRRIIWAIVCDGRFFFSKVKLSQDLIPGVGWKDRPTSLLNLILDKVMFAEPIMRPTFPIKWQYTMEPPPVERQNEQQGGTPRIGDRAQPQGGGNQGKGKGAAYQHGNQYQQGRTGGNQHQQQGCGNPQPWTSPRDARHPKIKALIDPLLTKDNRISVKAICRACGVPMCNLPGLAKYRDSTGHSTICWNNVLKGCGWSECPLKRVGGHVPREELTDGIAEVVCNKLGKGVTYLIHNHRISYESPQPK